MTTAAERDRRGLDVTAFLRIGRAEGWLNGLPVRKLAW